MSNDPSDYYQRYGREPDLENTTHYGTECSSCSGSGKCEICGGSGFSGYSSCSCNEGNCSSCNGTGKNTPISWQLTTSKFGASNIASPISLLQISEFFRDKKEAPAVLYEDQLPIFAR